MREDEARHCLRCGAALIRRERLGRVRPVCPDCDWIFFPDPKVAVAVMVVQGGRVLLIQRVNEPFRGDWSLPGGFMDAGENPVQAALRECLEETGLVVQVREVLDVIGGAEHSRGADVLIVYTAEVSGGELRAGDDADQAAFFAPDELPALAFSSTRRILERFLIDQSGKD